MDIPPSFFRDTARGHLLRKFYPDTRGRVEMGANLALLARLGSPYSIFVPKKSAHLGGDNGVTPFKGIRSGGETNARRNKLFPSPARRRMNLEEEPNETRSARSNGGHFDSPTYQDPSALQGYVLVSILD